MDPSLYAQWVPSQAPEEQRAGSSSEEWARDRTSQHQMAQLAHHQHPQQQHSQPQQQQQQQQQQQPPPVASPTMMNPTIMSDYTTLDDLAGPNSASLNSYYAPFLSPTYLAPYAMSYAQPWPNNPMPISNYSTLSGATSPPPTQQQSQPNHQQSQQQQQHQQQSPSQLQPVHSPPMSPASNHMMIDPVLSPNGSNPSFSSLSSYVPQHTQQQMQHPQQQQQPMQGQSSHMPRPPFANTHPHLGYNTMYYPQAQSAPQGTMSPQALHIPSNGTFNSFYAPTTHSPLQQGFSQPSQTQQQQQQPHQQIAISPPTASTSQHPNQPAEDQPSGLTADELGERKRKFLDSIRPLLLPTTLTGAGSVNALTDRITEYGIAEVDGPTRLEIMSKIRDGAGNGYYRAWSENMTALDITRDWVKAATKGNPALVDTIMPLLHFVDRLPATIECAKALGLGKYVKHLAKSSTPAIKDMAKKIENTWRTLVEEEKAKEARAREEAAAQSKKRKLDATSSSSKTAQPLKKAAVGGPTATRPVVKKELATSKASVAPAPVTKDAKADSSFFSAPKKAKLPSFKKAPLPPPVKKEPDAATANIAMGSSYDPFQEALKSMKGRKDSPTAAAPTPPPQSSSTEPQTGLAKNGKKKKTVTWPASQDELERIKFIERAIYDDDPVDGSFISHDFRDLDREEGKAMHAHLFEETLDWADPPPLQFEIEPMERGMNSREKVVQEEREQSALGAVYMTPNQIPDSPAEPTNILPDEEMHRELNTIPLGVELEEQVSLFRNSLPQPAHVQPQDTVENLVSKLGMVMTDEHMNVDPAATPGAPGAPGDVSGFAMPQTADLQSLLATLVQASGLGATSAPAHQHPNGDASGWPGMTPNQFDFGQQPGPNGFQQDDYQQQQGGFGDGNRGWGFDPRGRGRGGRGRGRGEFDRSRLGRHMRAKLPCQYYPQGRCKYGDHCDYLHDPSAAPNYQH